MSYCRIGPDSDVYVIASTSGYYECMGPIVQVMHAGDTFYCKDLDQMILHLIIHRAIGDKVPQRAIDRLGQELYEESRGEKPVRYP